MKPSFASISILAAAILASGSVQADKPAWAGKPAHAASQPGARAGGFDQESRRVIEDYYGYMARKGKCPPGLAKKNNGCMPPGQAKKWAAGQPLPTDLRYSRLPPDLLKRLPPPPPEHRYVRIAGDVLLIAIGTRMVIDAVEDILS